MEKRLGIITLISIMVISVPVVSYAQTATKAPTKAPTKAVEAEDEEDTTPTPTSKASSQDAAIEDLKKKVESKVSQLKNTNQKTIAGFITNIKDNKVSLASENETYEIQIDKDVTTTYKVNGSSTSEVDADTLKKDDYILVNGPEIGKSVTANAIYVDEHYISRSGKIIEVNSETYYIRVSTLEKDIYTIDNERTTTNQILNIKTLKVEPAGFSKLKEGDNIHFIAKKTSAKDQERYSAIKTIIIPQEYFNK